MLPLPSHYSHFDKCFVVCFFHLSPGFTISSWWQNKSTPKIDKTFLCPTHSETKPNFRSPESIISFRCEIRIPGDLKLSLSSWVLRFLVLRVVSSAYGSWWSPVTMTSVRPTVASDLLQSMAIAGAMSATSPFYIHPESEACGLDYLLMNRFVWRSFCSAINE